MFSRIVVGSTGLTIFCGTAYIVGIMAAPAPLYKVSNDQRLSVYEEIAPQYEKKTKRQEFYLGIGRMRRRLLSENATGRVLEVGAGTASNIGLYSPEKCDEVIFSDRATKMVGLAADKVFGRVGVQPYRYPDLPADEAAPVLLDKQTRKRQQKETEIEMKRREAAKMSGKKYEPTTTETMALTSSSSSSSDDSNSVEHTLHHHDENGNCVVTTMATKMVSLTATLLPKDQAEVVARRRLIAQKQRERKEKEAAAPSKAIGTTPNPNSREMLALAGTKQLYSVANYPAERLPFEDNEFDTIVDMFGLCSFDDPVAALGEMSRVCKPNGKVLLLEHGRGSWERINWYLDKWAPRHASSWGCWWNRDIRRMIRTAGLTIIKKEEKHFGTSMMYVCAPYKTMREMELAGRKN